MVKIAPPPPSKLPSPLFHRLELHQSIFRIFDPTQFSTEALTFRYYGAIHRFDHHRGTQPQIDPDRGIYYAAFTLSCCLVEYFGDTGVIEIQSQCLALVNITRPLNLLDLRGSGAMRAGSVAALAKTARRSLSQQWSRYFYEETSVYSAIDGIIYYNAHNDEDAIALYERAKDGLSCPSQQIIPLNDPSIRPAIQQVAINNHLIFVP